MLASLFTQILPKEWSNNSQWLFFLEISRHNANVCIQNLLGLGFRLNFNGNIWSVLSEQILSCSTSSKPIKLPIDILGRTSRKF